MDNETLTKRKENIKKIINELEAIEIVKKNGDVEIKEKPIVVMAPAGNDDTHLRVYGYGGDIGGIPLPTTDAKYAILKKSYYKYLIDGYRSNRGKNPDGKVGQVYNIPGWLEDNIPGDDDLDDKYVGKKPHEKLDLLNEESDKSKMFTDAEVMKLYWPLALATSANRFTTIEGNKQERWVQDLIAKKYIKKRGKFGDKSFVVSDLEFDLPLTEKRKKEKGGNASKPDFVVFDGESFGFVEFKYAGTAMGNSDKTRLDAHFLDFYDVMREQTDDVRWKAYGECISRCEILIDYGIVKDDDDVLKNALKLCKDKYEAVKDGSAKGDATKLFWCGFLFVDGDKSYIKDRINDQLIKGSEDVTNKLSKVSVYAQYLTEEQMLGEKSKEIFDMTYTIQKLVKKL